MCNSIRTQITIKLEVIALALYLSYTEHSFTYVSVHTFDYPRCSVEYVAF